MSTDRIPPAKTVTTAPLGSQPLKREAAPTEAGPTMSRDRLETGPFAGAADAVPHVDIDALGSPPDGIQLALEKLEALRAQSGELDVAIAALTEESRALDVANQKLTDANSQLGAEATKLRQQRDALDAEITVLEKQLSALAKEPIETREAKEQKLLAALDDKRRAANDLDKRIGSHEARIDANAQRLAANLETLQANRDAIYIAQGDIVGVEHTFGRTARGLGEMLSLVFKPLQLWSNQIVPKDNAAERARAEARERELRQKQQAEQEQK